MAQGEWRKITILLMLTLCLTEIQGASVHHLCGIHLVETLLLVCEGKGLYSRSLKGPLHNDKPFHRSASRNKKEIGIVERCCFHLCTLYDLQSYCKS